MATSDLVGVLIGSLVTVCMIVIFSLLPFSHEVGMDQAVCMTITNTLTEVTTKCASGEDLLTWLREIQ